MSTSNGAAAAGTTQPQAGATGGGESFSSILAQEGGTAGTASATTEQTTTGEKTPESATTGTEASQLSPVAAPVSVGSTSGIYSNLQGSMEDVDVPDNISDLSWNYSTGGTAATHVGEYKGTTDPVLANLLNAFQTILTIGKDQGSATVQRMLLYMGDTADWKEPPSGQISTASKNILDYLFNPTDWNNPVGTQRVTGAAYTPQKAVSAYKDALGYLGQLGIQVPAAAQSVNAANVFVKTNKLLTQTRLSASNVSQLSREGFDTSNMRDLADLLGDHVLRQQITKGSPGVTVTRPAIPTTQTKTTGAEEWDQFVNDWSNGTGSLTSLQYQNEITSELETAGLIPSTLTPNTTEVGQAYQQAIQGAASAGSTVTAWLGTQSPAGGQSIYQEEVQHMATNMGITLTPQQVTSLANYYDNQGATEDAADVVTDMIAGAYDPNNASATSTGGGLAQEAYEAIADTYGQWGLPVPSNINQQVASVLKEVSSTSPYQAMDFAQGNAETQAKAQAAQMYPSLAASINEGITPTQSASSYWSNAQSLLGVTPTAATPWGMAWASGGSGPGGQMTQQEWETYLKTSPQTSQIWNNSPSAKAAYADAASSLLQLFGKINPSTSIGTFNSAMSAANPNVST